jgi:hypothetical protein
VLSRRNTREGSLARLTNRLNAAADQLDSLRNALEFVQLQLGVDVARMWTDATAIAVAAAEAQVRRSWMMAFRRDTYIR